MVNVHPSVQLSFVYLSAFIHPLIPFSTLICSSFTHLILFISVIFISNNHFTIYHLFINSQIYSNDYYVLVVLKTPSKKPKLELDIIVLRERRTYLLGLSCIVYVPANFLRCMLHCIIITYTRSLSWLDEKFIYFF